MTKTVKVKLNGVTPEIEAEFMRLCDAFSQACDEVSVFAFENGLMLNHKALNDALYHSVRLCFNLKAQLAQSVFRTVIARYKTENTKLRSEYFRFSEDGPSYRFKKDLAWRESPIRFHTPQADLVRNRDYNFLEGGRLVSVATMTGRVRLTYSVKKDSPLFDDSWKLGTAKLLKKRGKWYLHIAVTKEMPEVRNEDIKEVVGIDRGIINLVTARDAKETTYVSGEEVARIRKRYAGTRASLQKKGTKGAKRVLKRLSGRENGWMADVNHQLSKALVQNYGADTLFVLEDLSGVSTSEWNLNGRDADGRYELRCWSFYDLEQKLVYKAEEAGSKVIKVDPQYTSQRCPDCGTIDKEARGHKEHRYVCPKCGCVHNDDEVAALNLRELGLRYLSGEEEPRFSKPEN